MEFHVIDDEKHVSDVIVAMLDVHGFSSKAFNCPRQYIEYTKTEDFKSPIAVMTDVSMPKMNGYEMIDELRKHLPDQKFVVISASTDVRHPAMKDVTTFLSKPVTLDILGKVASSLSRCHSNKNQQDI